MFRLFFNKTGEQISRDFRGGFPSISKFFIASACTGGALGAVGGVIAAPVAGWDAWKKSSPAASKFDTAGEVLHAMSDTVGKGFVGGAKVGTLFPVAAGIGLKPTCALVAGAIAVKRYTDEDTVKAKGPRL